MEIQTNCRCSMSSPIPNPGTHFDEHQWLIQIRQYLQQQQKEDENDHTPVSIFNVPNALMSTHSDLYTPQTVAIGPYHCCRPELYEMERQKLAAVKRIQTYNQVKLQDGVHKLSRLEHKIRDSYHNYINFTGDTLMWMMAIDSSFLIDFLQIYENTVMARVPSRMSRDAILRDIVMLENQIPLFVLQSMLEFHLPSTGEDHEMLFSRLWGICRELSPFKMAKDMHRVKLSDCSHLLDCLYHIVVPHSESNQRNEIMENQSEEETAANKNNYQNHRLNKLFLLLAKSMKFLSKLPWTILWNFPGISILKQHLDVIFLSETKENSSNLESSDNPPLVEEIEIPSVTELLEIGVRFEEASGNLFCIDFNPQNAVFSLPAIILNIHSEVILRNLVAYEAASASGPLIFTRYTELMNGIVDTEEDVKALRDRGIILNRLKSDAEVAELWNGMSKSIRLTKVPFLDKVIEDVNHYYHGRWKVKIGKFFRIYVLGSWQFLTFLAAVMLLFLMTVQAFCTLYSCARALPVKDTP